MSIIENNADTEKRISMTKLQRLCNIGKSDAKNENIYLDEFQFSHEMLGWVIVLSLGNGILVVHGGFGAALAPGARVGHLLGADATPRLEVTLGKHLEYQFSFRNHSCGYLIDIVSVALEHQFLIPLERGDDLRHVGVVADEGHLKFLTSIFYPRVTRPPFIFGLVMLWFS